MKTICYYHRIDMDGYASGAVIKKAFPDAELRGWNYGDELPHKEDLDGYNVILIDITFPIDFLQDLGLMCDLTVIDHHISFYKQTQGLSLNFKYYYNPNLSACELGWKKYIWDVPPESIEMIGKYDTWREYGTEKWENEILPLKEYCYAKCNSAETFPVEMLEYGFDVDHAIEQGKVILEAKTMENKVISKRAFEKEVYGGLKALCVNHFPSNIITVKSIWDADKYDIFIGFSFDGEAWNVSLRSEGDLDVSEIAKERGGGGHKNASGFLADEFQKIFI